MWLATDSQMHRVVDTTQNATCPEMGQVDINRLKIFRVYGYTLVRFFVCLRDKNHRDVALSTGPSLRTIGLSRG